MNSNYVEHQRTRDFGVLEGGDESEFDLSNNELYGLSDAEIRIVEEATGT